MREFCIKVGGNKQYERPSSAVRRGSTGNKENENGTIQEKTHPDEQACAGIFKFILSSERHGAIASNLSVLSTKRRREADVPRIRGASVKKVVTLHIPVGILCCL